MPTTIHTWLYSFKLLKYTKTKVRGQVSKSTNLFLSSLEYHSEGTVTDQILCAVLEFTNALHCFLDDGDTLQTYFGTMKCRIHI